ncbi:MAG: site-specific DNA-methyltransferase [Ignavibacteriales bacterium]|nr:MAG: site-specific DNA-methyltransferase [Ignavibacteriales bacterium]
MQNFPLPRIDLHSELHKLLLPYCRLLKGDTWIDTSKKHKVGCFNAEDTPAIRSFLKSKKATLAIQDPPYNFVAFQERNVDEFIKWSKLWIENTEKILDENCSLYIWLGADQNNHFQPLPEFMMMMSKSSFKSKSFITMRNQRGYGTQKNWMAIRQELLYYTKGNPVFNVNAEYTDIPKVLRGYYKTINGKSTENFERSKSENIRAGNVWVDVQQVFYRMEENVNGCYAQKPLKSIARIIEASSKENDIVVDLFAHSGTTLLACEQTGRKCYTIDADPVFCEIVIRRLEHFRKTGKTGWQNGNPFELEISKDNKLKKYLNSIGK